MCIGLILESLGFTAPRSTAEHVHWLPRAGYV